MKIGLAPSLSVEVVKHQTTIVAVDKDLNELIKDRNYGDDITELHIGITSVSPKFAPFFKVKPLSISKNMDDVALRQAALAMAPMMKTIPKHLSTSWCSIRITSFWI